MNEPEGCYRIVHWDQLYEPPARDGGGKGPLSFVRFWVYGHRPSESYELLITNYGQGGMTAFGLFWRLVDIAADEQRAMRDGVIHYRGLPATLSQISVMTKLPIQHVDESLTMLCARDIGWVEFLAADSAEYIEVLERCRLAERLPKKRHRRQTSAEEPNLDVERQDSASTATVNVKNNADCVKNTPNLDVAYSKTIRPKTKDVRHKTKDPRPRLGNCPENASLGLVLNSPTSETAPTVSTPGRADSVALTAHCKPDPDDNRPMSCAWTVPHKRRTLSSICVALGVKAAANDPQTNATVTTIRRALLQATQAQRNRLEFKRVSEQLIVAAIDKATADLRNPIGAWVAWAIQTHGDWRRESNDLDEMTPGPAGSSPLVPHGQPAHLSPQEVES